MKTNIALWLFGSKARKTLKIIITTILILLILPVGFIIYKYKTDPMLKAVIQNDETKLYYFPEKEMEDLSEFNYEEIVLKVEDTVEIYSYHFKPKFSKHKGNIFFIHGAGGNVSTYNIFIKPLVENGFAVYAPDWRGYGKSNGIPSYKGVIKDTEVAFKDFIRKTKSDSLNTIIYGMSLGGQLAVKIAKDNQDKIDGLVLDGSIQSAQQIAAYYAPNKFFKNRVEKSPENFNQDYVAIKDIKDIRKVPKLIIHSESDKEVPFEHGKNLFKEAKEPKTFWKTDTEHVMTLHQYPIETLEKINTLIR